MDESWCTLHWMSNFPSLDELNGATFDEITVDWRNGIALVGFLPSATRKECRSNGCERSPSTGIPSAK